MAFWKGGAKKRRDANEPGIIDALRGCGAYVQQLSGDGCPDLLVCWRGRWTPLEVKTAKGRLKPSQVKQQASTAPYPIVRSVSEALQVTGVNK
jgi:hypothetical protein